uniref:Putative capsid protein n=1 Tax=viral metagenome TaxID=1070528 RepID=A0A6M3KIK1_9ZZZZ
MTRPDFAKGYNEAFLNWWYSGGMNSVMPGAIADLKKANADYEWDAPTSPYATYQEPVFAAKVELWLARNSAVYSLLPKSTFLAKGDSFKFVETELSGLTNVGPTSTPFASLAVESAPTIVDLEQMKPGFYADPWKINFVSRVESTWQKATEPATDPAFIKQFHAEALPHQIDKLLVTTVDTASGSYKTESLDRLLTIYDEASTTYCNAATDPDIYFGKSATIGTRASDSDDTWGCGAGAASTTTMLGSGTTTGARVLKLDYVDAVLAESIKYSKNKRYIIITGPKTINEMQKLIDPKQRYLNSEMDYQQTLNGVSTRKGVEGGFTVGALISNGLTIPVFGSDNVPGESSSNISATVTSQNIGNIYIVDLDAVELRIAVPVTYLETPPQSMATMDYLQTRHMFLWAGQLIATNPRANAVVKYLKSS